MGAYFAKQPNGLYCRFSTIVDTITHYNLTKEAAEIIKEEIRWILNDRLGENAPIM